MAFRSGSNIKLLLQCNDLPSTAFTLFTPKLFDLQLSLIALGKKLCFVPRKNLTFFIGSEWNEDEHVIVTNRDGCFYSIDKDRDVEELGKKFYFVPLF